MAFTYSTVTLQYQYYYQNNIVIAGTEVHKSTYIVQCPGGRKLRARNPFVSAGCIILLGVVIHEAFNECLALSQEPTFRISLLGGSLYVYDCNHINTVEHLLCASRRTLFQHSLNNVEQI